MHRLILGVTLGLTFTATVAAAPQGMPPPAECPRGVTAVTERFIDADCADCWTRQSLPPAASAHWVLDWIVPSARGDDAPLAPAATREAADRIGRIGERVWTSEGLGTWRTPLRAGASPSLSVASGPAWHGYLALQVDSRGPWPRGASVWLALVEAVPEGTDGTPVARRLVRAVAGPLDLAQLANGRTVRDLRALRWPETAQPARLRATAWIETADGRIVAMAAERCPWRPRR